MEYTHVQHPQNPQGEGIERVADIYVARNVDLRRKPSPSDVFLACAKGNLSDAVAEILDELVRAGLARTSER